MRRYCARRLLSLCGWRLEGVAPGFDRYVLIAAPHTSNWDFVWMLLMANALGINISWFGKHTLFSWPFGSIMRRLGGIAVHRDFPGDLVQTMAQRFASREHMALAVPVEGSRGHRDYWRSGFYHIARAAQVPVVFSYLDYSRRCGGIGPNLTPTDDPSADMNLIRSFYEPLRGKHPSLSGPIRLLEENPPAEP